MRLPIFERAQGGPWLGAIGSLCLVLFQVLEGCLLGEGKINFDAFSRFSGWDSVWYQSILTHGYLDSPSEAAGIHIVGNLAFFPGYPLAAKALWALWPSLGARGALLLASLLGAFGFWWAVLVLFQRTKAQRGAQFFGIALILFFPTSFFLVTAYSESLFLFSLLLFLGNFSRDTTKATGLTLAAGIVCSGTRIVGVGVAFGVPLATAFLKTLRWPTGRTWLISVVGACGGLGYFLFCQLRFGDWAIYQRFQSLGWNVRADWFALFRYRTYFPRAFPGLWGGEDISPYSLSQCLTSFFAWLWLVILWKKLRPFSRQALLSESLPFFIAGFLLFFLPVTAFYRTDFNSMSRYLFPVEVCLVVAWVYDRAYQSDWASRAKRLTPFLIVSAHYHFFMFWRFLHKHWVA